MTSGKCAFRIRRQEKAAADQVMSVCGEIEAVGRERPIAPLVDLVAQLECDGRPARRSSF